jgi:biopolymer transport protein ExbB
MNFTVRRASRFALAIGAILIVFSTIAGSSTTSLLSAANPVVSSSDDLPLAVVMPVVTPQNQGEQSTPPPVPAKKGINFLSLLTQGGWFMFPLLLLSIGVVTIAIERFLALRREKIFPPELIEQLSLLSQSPGGLDPRRAYQACQQYPSSASYVIRSMLVKVGRPHAELENAVAESSQREATRLTQMTSWLSLAAAIAPLIGLLGTVWGITQAFYDTTQLAELNAGQNRGVALANGIYVALVTTMAGLMIAIPAAVISHFYENRVIKLMNEIEEMVYNLLPQFERYEGQVRFTQGVGDDDSIQTDSEIDSQFVSENGAGQDELTNSGELKQSQT